MSVIDFREVTPEAFEYFTRDFLETLSMQVEAGPDRGKDDGRDLIVRERSAVTGRDTVWLVSCKHKAFSGRSVTKVDEPDIRDRLKRNAADKFMGVYSTPPSSGLGRALASLCGSHGYFLFDPERIEQTLLANQRMQSLLMRYFPKSLSGIEARRGPTSVRVVLNAGYPFYRQDISLSLTKLLHHEAGELRISDPALESTVAGWYLAQQLKAGNFEVLGGVASVEARTWEAMCVQLRRSPPGGRAVARGIRRSTDSFRLRLMVRLAGDLGLRECSKVICETVLREGRGHTRNIRAVGLPVTPFYEVARRALEAMPRTLAPVLRKYEAHCAGLRMWQQKKLFALAAKYLERTKAAHQSPRSGPNLSH